MMNKAGPFQALADLGSGPLTTKQERAALEFVLQLYVHSNSKCTNLNELRYDKYILSWGPTEWYVPIGK